MNKDKVVVIVGPTAVGKSDAGIKLATHFKGEIISGDSMQIYKGLDIGTAKVSAEEQSIITHHLIDEKYPSESYSAASFQWDAGKLIRDMNEKGILPFVVGGTGFYIRSLTRGLDFNDSPTDPTFRKEMERIARDSGAHVLHEKLRKTDPKSAAAIHPNNVKKVIRALEINHLTGSGKRDFTLQEDTESPFDLIMVGLTMERSHLYKKINERVDKMVQLGIIEEARWLYENYSENCQAAQAIGYKEFFPYFKGECEAKDAIELLKRNSRRYAKRQLTWFRNKEKVQWYDVTEQREEKIQEMISFIEGKFS